jgi:hypothetical protein
MFDFIFYKALFDGSGKQMDIMKSLQFMLELTGTNFSLFLKI